jgi:hypothetical protein
MVLPPNIRQLMVSTILAFWYFYHLLFKDTADEGYTKNTDKHVQQRIYKQILKIQVDIVFARIADPDHS